MKMRGKRMLTLAFCGNFMGFCHHSNVIKQQILSANKRPNVDPGSSDKKHLYLNASGVSSLSWCSFATIISEII